MAKKPRRRRSGLRSATKVQERGLQATADRLVEEPDLVIPRCLGHRPHFKKEAKVLAKVVDHEDDDKKLAAFARRAPPIARAVAATLLAGSGEAEKIIMLQVPTPYGKVPVASRGKAKTTHLVGVQYHDDRKLRMLLVADRVKAKRLSFYSMPAGGIVCGGKEARPPPEFVEAEAQGLGLLKDPEGWACAHAIHAEERLTIHWKAAGVRLRKCAACARDGNTLLSIVQHIAAREVLGGFDVAVDTAPLPQGGSKPADPVKEVPMDPSALERYKKGEIDDAGLLEAQRGARLDALRRMPGPLYVHGGVNYGRDLDAFLDALKPTALEETALRGALEGHDATVVLEKGSATRVITDLWADRGLAMLEAVAGNPEVAREVHEAHDVAAKGVGPALQQAQAKGLRTATDKALPTYRALPPGPHLADAVARAYRSHGKPAALALLDGNEDPALKGLVHALELGLDAGQGKGWKYTPLETDLAKQLEPHARALLTAKAEAYHEKLQALSRA